MVAGMMDAGAPRPLLEETLAGLPLPPESFRWELRREERHHLAGTRFEVRCAEEHDHRHWSDVRGILDRARLTKRARAWAQQTFAELAEAEGAAHGCAAEEVHFHEVGAVDAIVDVAAACALLDSFGSGGLWSSAVVVGSGTTEAAHGTLPVPAPGTLRLLNGMPICGTQLAGERATPTGVALLRAWQARFGERPAGLVVAAGHGLGAKDFSDRANLLRVEVEELAVGQEWLVELRALVDDQSGEVIGAALEALHAAGAVEAYAVAAVAKKNRPAFEVVVLAPESEQDRMRALCFRLLGTLGLRVAPIRRSRIPRGVEDQDTALGRLPFKWRETDGAALAKPEFDALRIRATQLGLTPREAREKLTGKSDNSPSA